MLLILIELLLHIHIIHVVCRNTAANRVIGLLLLVVQYLDIPIILLGAHVDRDWTLVEGRLDS